MTLSITKLTFNALNPIKRFTLDKNTSKSGTDPDKLINAFFGLKRSRAWDTISSRRKDEYYY